MTTSRTTFREAVFTPDGPGFSYLVVMVLICVVLFRGFRRSGWL